jgi:uncharacterized membrane protein YbhN (UPF0104 family)
LKKTVFKLLKTVLPLALGVYLVWVFFQNMTEKLLNYFLEALQEATYLWIILTLFLSFFAFIIRTYRWKYSLETLGSKITFNKKIKQKLFTNKFK